MKDEISSSLNTGLHILVTITEHVCDCVLKLLKYRLQIFLAKDYYLESLQLYGDQIISGQLKKRVHQHVLPILMTYMDTRL